MIKKTSWSVLAAIIVLAGTGVGPADLQAAPNIAVTLAANPLTYNGDCPVQVTFTVGFKVAGPCTITYHFTMPKGNSQDYTLLCKAAGTFTAVKTLPVGSFQGGVAVQVTSPVSVQSNQVMLDIKCKAKPHITSAKLNYGGDPIPEIDIIGSGFGATQGAKNVKFDGTLVTAIPGWSIIHWGDNLITVKTTSETPVIPWEHVYMIVITQGALNVSNTYSAKFKYTIDGINPTSGLVGTVVTIGAWSLPAAQDSYVVRIGSYTMTGVVWGSPIKANVPSGIPAGTHNIYLQKGPDMVSNAVPFNVLAGPTITSIKLNYAGGPSGEIDIFGTNFGATQGTKNVQVDGTLITSISGWHILHWGDTSITVGTSLSVPVIPWDHIYQIAVTEGSTVVSNLFSVRFKFTIDGVNPTSGPAGTLVTIGAWNLPASQDSYVVRIGSYTMTGVIWGPGLKAHVPSGIPLGTHNIYLQKGPDMVSNQVPFIVQ